MSHWDTASFYRGVLFSLIEGSMEKRTDRPAVKILFSELWCNSVRWPNGKLLLNLVGLLKANRVGPSMWKHNKSPL